MFDMKSTASKKPFGMHQNAFRVLLDPQTRASFVYAPLFSFAES